MLDNLCKTLMFIQVTDAKVLIFDPTLFKLNLLLTMTQQKYLDSENAFSKLHFKYSTILRRRLWWMHANGKLDQVCLLVCLFVFVYLSLCLFICL